MSKKIVALVAKTPKTMNNRQPLNHQERDLESSGELGDSVDGNLFNAFRCLNLRMLRPRNMSS